MLRFIGYVRVSADSQSKDASEPEAQRAAIRRFAEAESCEMLAEFVETDIGEIADALEYRPELAAALGLARKIGAAIVVARLDKLSHDIHLIPRLCGRI